MCHVSMETWKMHEYVGEVNKVVSRLFSVL